MNVESKIRELVKAHLADNHRADPVRFVEELLDLSGEAGEISCSFAGESELRFQVADEPPWKVELGRAKTKLRMCCARLGVLCNESGDQGVSLYGGEGVVKDPELSPSRAAVNGPAARNTATRSRPVQWAVRFKNTPDKQELTIVAG